MLSESEITAKIHEDDDDHFEDDDGTGGSGDDADVTSMVIKVKAG